MFYTVESIRHLLPVNNASHHMNARLTIVHVSLDKQEQVRRACSPDTDIIIPQYWTLGKSNRSVCYEVVGKLHTG